jgi:predicted amidohydrolase YtcJ
MRAVYQGNMLHSGRVKIFLDGILESMAASMLVDYPGFPGQRDAPLFTAVQFSEVTTLAEKHGLQISVYAIVMAGFTVPWMVTRQPAKPMVKGTATTASNILS